MLVAPPLKALGMLTGTLVLLAFQAGETAAGHPGTEGLVQTILTVAGALGVPVLVKAWWERAQKRRERREDAEDQERRQLRHDNVVLGRYAERAYALLQAQGIDGIEPPPLPAPPTPLVLPADS